MYVSGVISVFAVKRIENEMIFENGIIFENEIFIYYIITVLETKF